MWCLTEVYSPTWHGNIHKPLYLKTVCRPGRNVIQITGPTSSHPFLGEMFVLRFVYRPSVRTVIDILLKKRLVPPSDCIARIKRYFEILVVEETKINVPLKCTISKRRIILPARGNGCHHIQCFDLESYLKRVAEGIYFYMSGRIVCPICHAFVTLDLLEVDQYMWRILTSLESTGTEEIVIDRKAQWRTVPLKLEKQENTTLSSVNEYLPPSEGPLWESQRRVSVQDEHGRKEADEGRRMSFDKRSSLNATAYTKQHNFEVHTYIGFHRCDYCNTFLWGLRKQGHKCQDCGYNAHKQCIGNLKGKNCTPDRKLIKREKVSPNESTDKGSEASTSRASAEGFQHTRTLGSERGSTDNARMTKHGHSLK